MKLLALAAVMMVSGTMVGQAGKAAGKPHSHRKTDPLARFYSGPPMDSMRFLFTVPGAVECSRPSHSTKWWDCSTRPLTPDEIRSYQLTDPKTADEFEIKTNHSGTCDGCYPTQQIIHCSGKFDPDDDTTCGGHFEPSYGGETFQDALRKLQEFCKLTHSDECAGRFDPIPDGEAWVADPKKSTKNAVLPQAKCEGENPECFHGHPITWNGGHKYSDLVKSFYSCKKDHPGTDECPDTFNPIQDDPGDDEFDFNAPGPIAWKDPYYVKYKSGWMCTRELVEKRDTICFRMLESFHWAAFDCEKDSVVCRDVKEEVNANTKN